MIRFVAIEAFVCFYKFLSDRIEIRRFDDSRNRCTKLIKISDHRFCKCLFCFLIDRDRDRDDAHRTTDCSFRFDLDRNDCTRSSSRFNVVNTLVVILFQLRLTNEFVYVINDIEFDKHYVLQFIKYFSFKLNKQEMFWQIHFFHETLKFVSENMKFCILVYLSQSRKSVHCRQHFIRICINSFQVIKHLVYDQISTCEIFI
jgi:hypothetical protein